MGTNQLVDKIWKFCDTLRDDGVTYGDYLEQITYLLFLKMADEYSSAQESKNYNIPNDCNWKTLKGYDVSTILHEYQKILNTLADSGGMIKKIFSNAQNKISDSKKLKKLIDFIDEESWISESTDVKGDIYEALLQKNAENSGAGQYFTPRSVIKTMVECICPQLNQTIADPACGTGGFFLGALEYIHKTNKKISKEEANILKFKTFHGWEIVDETARLCLMNLFLHGIGDLINTPEIEVVDSLKEEPKKKFDIILANPPFGKSSSDIPTNDIKKTEKDSHYYYRGDFWTTTSNKQLSFLQHIVSMLKENGVAAVVLPDNVLFEGGTGELIRKELLEQVNLHTILRLPTGIFYANGVKANVLFFQKRLSTKEIWYYDYRTNINCTLKKKPLRFEDLQEFVSLYLSLNRVETWSVSSPDGRWRRFSIEELISRGKINLDIFWLKDENYIDLENLPKPDVLIDKIYQDLENVLRSIQTIKDGLT
ncbi:putative type I restriction enzymeP M protein [termite gut metagenome]|uniref:site-specific DNA-methyltransferase (adenine-specific) n=1 Tax=termite gut metagenome TaxID=433724 RepID=A0A5J4QLJ1_9ZZZZ